jgi:AbrB family transcriptional regulator, transcriptional pleiotropic regulator of transition state genes
VCVRPDLAVARLCSTRGERRDDKENGVIQSEELAVDGALTVGTGAIRRVDALGRVVLPIEIRRTLGIRQGDLIQTRLENGRVVIVKVEPDCAVCGGLADLFDMHEKHVCGDCVRGLVEKTTRAYL